MQIDIIDNLAEFDRLAERWDALYAGDAHAQFFMSWSWLRHWFEITPYRWFVLAARPDHTQEYVAFLPLAGVVERRCGVGLRQLLYMGGKPISDYTGFVADSAHAAVAIPELGRYVAEQLTWDWFDIAHVIDERLELFLQGLNGERIRVRREEPVGCPCATLPQDWDAYLGESLSAKGRANLRRGMRMIETMPDFRATLSTADSIACDADIVLGMWRSRWGSLAAHDLGNYRHMLRRTLDDGRLCLRILWTGKEPVAALAGLLDPVKRAFMYYLTGFNERFARISPGKVVVGWCIRDAIVQGYERFDFLLGLDEYKTSFFNAPIRLAQSVTVQRMDIASRVRGRLARWLGPARVAAS